MHGFLTEFRGSLNAIIRAKQDLKGISCILDNNCGATFISVCSDKKEDMITRVAEAN